MEQAPPPVAPTSDQSSSMRMHGVAELHQKSMNPKLSWNSVWRSGRIGFGFMLFVIGGTLFITGVPSRAQLVDLERMSFAQREVMKLWTDQQQRLKAEQGEQK